MELLKNKKVSIWGIGYLGYTTVLKLEQYGFTADIFDFSEDRLEGLTTGRYPENEQKNSWSKDGKVPSIDLSKVTICKDYSTLFENQIHIISFPESSNSYDDLIEIFKNYQNRLKNSIIIFQSVSYPGRIDELIKKAGFNLNIATIFRSDWNIEDFLMLTPKRVVATNNDIALKKTVEFLTLLNIEPIVLNSIKEAEVYENAKNAFDYVKVAFFNELSLAYADVDINKISTLLGVESKLGVSSVDFKSELAIENLLKSGVNDHLTILKEANSTNISFLFYYASLLKKRDIKKVAILGMSSHNAKKDLKFSPSVILAEYLSKNGFFVEVQDEHFSKDEINEILPEVNVVSLKDINAEVVFIMNLNKSYKFLTQKDIENNGFTKAKIIIDNTGFFNVFDFKNTIYHNLCDGSLARIKA